MTRALARRDGTVLVDVTTGDFDVAGSSGGTLGRVQSKVLSNDRKVSTKSYDGLGQVTYGFSTTEATRGSPIAIQADVRNGDNSRNDVVTANDTVRLAPDLAVDRVEVPESARRGDVFTVSAIVSERNGEVGARANCVLYIGGVKTDVNSNIWVAAGDRVTCAFATRITTDGRYDVTVKVENVVPFDFDASNNAGSTSIVIGAPRQPGGGEPTERVRQHREERPLLYTATAFEHSGTYFNNYTYTYADYDPLGYRSTYKLLYSETIRTQSTHMYAWVEQPISFPVSRVHLSLRTHKTVVDARTYSDFAAGASFGDANDGGTCGTQTSAGAAAIVCTYHRGTALWSTVTYDRYAGAVTYVSLQYASYTAPWGSGYYFNTGPITTNQAWGNAVTPFGSTVSFSVRLTSGHSVFTTNNALIKLVPNAYSTRATPCYGPFANAGNTGTFTECYDIGGDYLDKEGFVNGPGV